ncbi:MAG: tRNA (adenosine(37)-N6)-dimethylallyltransferase MiaA, partial [Anaerolineae bacterium]|nr:tRNA (adenosine(37)-N6)-dimethylallyltransferase MiaA [Anaerolineae bacterium]
MWRTPLTGKQPLVVILGATATGKTQLGIAIAQELNGEIIGADSRQVYRFMNIGTAKPTAEERESVVHHLVDYLD